MVKVHQRDTDLYERVMAHLQKHKDSELAFEDLFTKLEEELRNHKDIYEELLLIMDVKKFSKYSQTLMNSLRENKKNFRVGQKQLTSYNIEGFGNLNGNCNLNESNLNINNLNSNFNSEFNGGRRTSIDENDKSKY